MTVDELGSAPATWVGLTASELYRLFADHLGPSWSSSRRSASVLKNKIRDVQDLSSVAYRLDGLSLHMSLDSLSHGGRPRFLDHVEGGR